MVCVRCKMVVKSELEKFGLHYVSVELGEAEITDEITASQREGLAAALKETGLELMEDKKNILVERIRHPLLNWSTLQMTR